MKVLEKQTEIAIDRGIKDFPGMYDEPTNLSECFLHRHVRVIEKRAFLVDVKLKHHRLARFDQSGHQRDKQRTIPFQATEAADSA